MAFENNVFINCPFDEEYRPLLRAIVFTSIYLGLEPKLSQTISSANIRINQIKDHIRSSKYGIHDISRNKSMKDGELPRFNMPYELGLDIGASEFGNKLLRTKRILILDTEKYHFQKVLSDIAGQDIAAHNNDPKELVRRVRDWVSLNAVSLEVPSSSRVWIVYNQFKDDLMTVLSESHTEEEILQMTNGDYIKFCKRWIETFQAK
jgi:hypothetical protein